MLTQGVDSNGVGRASSRSALIVEDDVDIRDMLSEVLRSAGFATASCKHGREALAYLRRESNPGVIVLDLMMPVMDGWEFRLEQLRDPELSSIPVVALSADGTPKAAAVNADAYLEKPVAADTLVHTVERVVLLHENRLLHAQLAESQRLRSLGTLAAGVAHEINNPLSYVILNLEFVAEQLPRLLDALGSEGNGGNGEARPRARADEVKTKLFAAVEHAKQGAERIRTIVRGMKTFSRPEHEAQGRVDVREALESSVSMLLHEITGRARLVRDYEDVPAVDANEARLGQVFLNLLVNAMQSLTEGADNEIRLRVRHASPHVIVEVCDTGGGIPEDVRGRIFEPFFTTKAVGVGTGLGLPICHGIVRSLGGELTFETEVGRGTTFRVALPAATSHS